MKRLLPILTLVLVLGASFGFSQKMTVPKVSMSSEYFVENKGQWDERALFLSKYGNLNFWITNNGVTYDYFVIERDLNEMKPDGITPNKDNYGKITNLFGHVVITEFLGANKSTSVEKLDKKEGIVNFIIGNDESKWRTHIGMFGNVIHKNVYDNIDVSYFFENHQIRYDFIVRPYADPSKIRIKFDGPTSLSIAPNGDLVIGTSVGEIYQTKLYAYQNVGTSQQKIDCSFRIENGNVVTFDLGSYDNTKELIIDPTYTYGSYFGGNSTDYVYSSSIDAQGRPMATGSTYSTNLPSTSGAYQGSYEGNRSTFVVKFNTSSSSLVFCTYLGGSSSDYAYGIGDDGNGNTIVGGYTYSTNWPTTSGAFQTSYQSTPDLYVTKLNANGTALIWSTYLAGNNSDYMYALKVKNGVTYITGYTYSSNWPTTSGAYKTSIPGTPCVYATALNGNGNGLVASTFIGYGAYGYGIDADNSGNMYVTGYAYSTNYPTTTGAYGTYSYYDVFVSKISSNGTQLVYSTFIPTSSYTDYGYGIGVDSQGQATVTGYTSAPTWPKINAYRTTIGGTDAFVTKLNANGTGLIFSTYAGGNNTDYGRDIVIDQSDNVYLIGYTYSTDLYLTADRFQTVQTTPDVFLMRFGPNGGTPTYSTYLGGNNTDLPYYFQCSDINASNQLSIGGYTYSSNFPLSTIRFQSTLGTTPEGFISVFTFEPPAKLYFGDVNPKAFCAGENLTVTYSIEGTYKSDNQFIVELSDDKGSFANPIQIGSISGVTAQPIVCTTPSNMMPATGYLVRVRSTNPAMTSEVSKELTVYPRPLAQKMLGDGGFCTFDEKGAEIKLEKTEKFSLYQLYRNGEKVGSPVVGDGGEISFGYTKATGKYTVEGISPMGCKNWMSGEINVREIPSPIAYNITGGGPFYNQPGPGTYCEGGEGVAIGLSKSEVGVKYQLRLDGKNINVPINGTGDELSFGFVTEPGTYTIYAETILGGCPNTMNGSIKVSILPAPKQFDIIAQDALCEGSLGNEFKLSGSETGTIYQLLLNGKKVGNAISGTGAEISFGKFKELGKYQVLATNTTTGCTKLFEKAIELKSIPLPKKFEVKADKYFCQGSEGVEFFLMGSEKDVIYQLMQGNNAVGNPVVGTGGQISLGYSNVSGTYTVVGKTINGGCANSMLNAVQIQELPAPNSIIKGEKNPQINSTEQYWVEDTFENDKYKWNVTNGTIEGPNDQAKITVKWTDKRTGKVEVWRENVAGCRSEGVLDITLKNDIVPEFTAEKTEGDAPFMVSFKNKSTGYITYYNWDFGDGGSSPLPNPTYTYKVPGKYTVTLTIGYQDVRVTKTMKDMITVHPAGSVKDEQPESNSLLTILPLDPNPATSLIRLSYNAKTEQEVTISIYDIMGNKVMNVFDGTLMPGTNEMSIDINNLPNGAYLLQIVNKEGILAKFFNVSR